VSAQRQNHRLSQTLHAHSEPDDRHANSAPGSGPIFGDMTRLKILHVVPDEKFIDFFHRMCSKAGDADHSFYLDMPANNEKRYIRHTPIKGLVDTRRAASASFRRELAEHDCVVLHFMSGVAADIAACTAKGPLLVWSGWGGDYVDLLPGGQSALLGPLTSRLVTERWIGMLRRHPVLAVREGLRPSVARALRARQWRLALRRVDCFSAPIEADFHALKSSLRSRFPAQFLQLNYGSVASARAESMSHPDARDILVGNSASVTNNHLEIFAQLSRSNIGDRRVVVPLSYGDPWYRDKVCDHGRRTFGSRFRPLIDFLPLDEYQKLLRECSVAIFNHFRQQALGNIVELMSAGTKVLMNPRSPIYQMLRARGALIGSAGTMTAPIDLVPLSPQEAARNREIILSLWGDDAVRANFEEFYRRVREHRDRVRTLPKALPKVP
jgi:dTDP-N-acetylfucosamine:lipid II N-acetylfucosaminyltransferase